MPNRLPLIVDHLDRGYQVAGRAINDRSAGTKEDGITGSC